LTQRFASARLVRCRARSTHVRASPWAGGSRQSHAAGPLCLTLSPMIKTEVLMKTTIVAVLVALIVGVFALPAGSPAMAPAIEDPAGPILVGKVTIDGDKPDLNKLDKDLQTLMKAKDEAHCLAEKASEDEKSQQAWKIDDKGGVGNVFVWIAPPRGQFFKVDMKKKAWPEKVVIDQPHCAFVPHAVVVFPKYRDDNGKLVSTDQTFVVGNSAEINHNVNVEGGVNSILPAHSKKPLLVELEPSSKPLEIKCNIHTWMNAFALPLDHPFAAITKADGTYRIEKVPKGMEVTIFAWHEKAGLVNEDRDKGQTIKLSEKTEVNFKVKAP
jgi:hypothetical protein